MSKTIKTNRVARLKRGLASTILLTSLVAQASPLLRVTAETVEYDHSMVTKYKTADGEYVIEVNPMTGKGNQDAINPRSGIFTIKQTEQYDASGNATKVEGKVNELNLKENEENKYILNSDGTYELNNTKRVPGFYRDTKTYRYTLPLIEDGKLASNQTINFQPKLSPVLGDIEFVKVDENNEPLEGVQFDLYQTYDATSGIRAPESEEGVSGGLPEPKTFTDAEIPEYYQRITMEDIKYETGGGYSYDGVNRYEGDLEYILLDENVAEAFKNSKRQFRFDRAKNIKGVATTESFTKAVTRLDLDETFRGVEAESLDLRYFNTENAVNMGEMFSSAKIDGVLDISTFNTSNVTKMKRMFFRSTIGELKMSNFDTSGVKKGSSIYEAGDASGMFEESTIGGNFNASWAEFKYADFTSDLFREANIPGFDGGTMKNYTPSIYSNHTTRGIMRLFNKAIVSDTVDLSGVQTKALNGPYNNKSMFTSSTIKTVLVGTDADAEWFGKQEFAFNNDEQYIVKDSEEGGGELTTEPIASLTTGTEGKVAFDSLTEGTYYVQESKTVDGKALNTNKIEFEVTTDSDGTKLIVREIGDLDLNDDDTHGKTFINYDQSRVDKKLRTSYTDGSGYVSDEQMVETHGTVNYNIEVDVPNDIKNYKEYSITDTLSPKLKVKEDTLSVIGHYWKGDSTIDLTKYAKVTENKETGEQVITLDITETPELKNDLIDLEKAVIKYNAEIDTSNVEAEETVTNTVIVDWDNGTGDKDKVEDAVDAVIKEGAVEVVKQDGRDEELTLEGAEFQIYKLGTGKDEMKYKGKTYIPVTNPRTKEQYVGTTDKEGNVIFDSIPFGNYLLVETKAPEGYRLNNTHVEFSIHDTETQEIEGVEDSIRIKVDNYKKTDILPATGTTGIIVSLLVGGTLMVTGASLNKAKKEEETDEE